LLVRSRQLGVADAGDLADRLAEPGKVEIGFASPRQQPEPPGQMEPVCGNQSPSTPSRTSLLPRLPTGQRSLTLLALSTVTDTVMVRVVETASFNCSHSLPREEERRSDRASNADE
jgi:hypothetical protein